VFLVLVDSCCTARVAVKFSSLQQALLAVVQQFQGRYLNRSSLALCCSVEMYPSACIFSWVNLVCLGLSPTVCDDWQIDTRIRLTKLMVAMLQGCVNLGTAAEDLDYLPSRFIGEKYAH